MDVFDEHVYADTSALPPSMPHTGSTIAEGDYTKLVALLGKAFDGTAQRGSTLPIFYGEYGVETTIPADKGARVHRLRDRQKTVDEATQARYYAEAFRLALCQPNVIGIMVFHVDRRERARRMAVRAVLRRRHAEVVAAGDPRRRARRARGDPRRAPTARRRPWRSRRRAASSTAAASDGVGVGKVSALRQRPARRREVRGAVQVRVAAARRAATRSRCARRRGRQRRAEVRQVVSARTVGAATRRLRRGWVFTRVRPKRGR